MSLLRVAWTIAAKDLRVEARGRHAAGMALPFAATLLIAFGLSLGPGRTLLEATAPGLLWLAMLFAVTLLARRAYEAEAEDGALEGLVLAPVDKAAVFAGKTVALAAQLVVVEVAVLAMVVVLFGLPLGGDALLLAAALAVALAAVRRWRVQRSGDDPATATVGASGPPPLPAAQRRLLERALAQLDEEERS